MTRDEMIKFLTEFCDGQEHECGHCPLEHTGCYFMNKTNEELANRIKIIMKTSPTQISDPVDHPKHYELPGGMEVVDVEISTQGIDSVKDHCICAAIEYLLRHKRKNGVEDVRKAHWWLTKYIELEGKAK